MNQRTDQRIEQLFASEPVNVPAKGFEAGVMRRIRKTRRIRLVAKSLAAVVLFGLVLVLSPDIVRTAGYVGEYSEALTETLGKLVTRPAAFVVGILISLYALFEVRYR